MSEETTGSSEAENEKKRRLSDEDWSKLITEYEYGATGVVELSEKFGISRQAIAKKFKERGVVRGSRRAEYENQQQQIQQAAQKKAQAVAETYSEKRAEWIEETRRQGYASLKQAVALLNQRILEVYKTPGTPPASALEDIKALKLYQKALIENFDFRLNGLLNANDSLDEKDLPTLIIDDMTVDDVIEHFRDKSLIDEDADFDELRGQIEATQAEVRSLA